jgi:hypothetical protein
LCAVEPHICDFDIEAYPRIPQQQAYDQLYNGLFKSYLASLRPEQLIIKGWEKIKRTLRVLNIAPHFLGPNIISILRYGSIWLHMDLGVFQIFSVVLVPKCLCGVLGEFHRIPDNPHHKDSRAINAVFTCRHQARRSSHAGIKSSHAGIEGGGLHIQATGPLTCYRSH